MRACSLASEAHKIDPDYGNPRSYLYGTDFHRRRPGSAVFGEPPGVAHARGRAHLIENSTRVVEIGIDGPLEIFVVSLCPHQPGLGSKVSLS